MKEITDEALSAIRSNLSACNPLVQSLVVRLDRVEGGSMPRLARHQPCGCIVCTCTDDEQCHGCGAEYCGTHDPFEIPNPVYESHPLVTENTALRERIKRMEGALQRIATYSTYDAQDLRDMAQDALEEGE